MRDTSGQASAGDVRTEPQFTCLSIFSGGLGLDIGLERIRRFQLLGCLEYDPVFCETIRRNRDAGRVGSVSMPVWEGDIRHIDPEAVMGECGLQAANLDLLVGGPPCQSFSTAGRRRSVEDPRGELLWQYLRYVVALRPKMFLMENVRGLVSAALRHRPIAERPEKGGPPLEPDEVPGSVMRLWLDDLQRLTEGEYRVDCFEVNAVNYGAPQLRERTLFVGNRLGVLVDFPQPTHGPANGRDDLSLFEAHLEPFGTLRDAIGDLHEEDPVLMDFSPRKKHFLSLVPAGGNWRSLPEELQRESMGKAFFAKGGRSGWWRRLSWDLPCPTVVTMPNHASTSMCHPDEVRTLSVRECAAIQEFPAEWVFSGKPAQQYVQVGNAVPARLGEVAGEVIARTLDGRVGADVEGLSDTNLPVFRRIYIRSHVRTRQWYRNGEVFVWKDGEDNGHANYSAARRR